MSTILGFVPLWRASLTYLAAIAPLPCRPLSRRTMRSLASRGGLES